MQSKKHVENDGKVSLTKVEYGQLTWAIEEDKEKVMIPKAFKKRTPVCQDQISRVFFFRDIFSSTCVNFRKSGKSAYGEFRAKKVPVTLLALRYPWHWKSASDNMSVSI